MEVGSVTGWIALVAVAVFILAPVIWFGILRKSRE